jgi:hypothetical protein
MVSPRSEARVVNEFLARFMDTTSGILEKRAFGAITDVATAQQLADSGIQDVRCRARAYTARRILNVKLGNENRMRLSINVKISAHRFFDSLSDS